MRDSGARRVTPAALFGKLPISFPFGEEPTGGEGADVGEGTELFVGDVDFPPDGCTFPASVARCSSASASLNSALLVTILAWRFIYTLR
jgi:hypothetical protein